jgi:DNA helicase-2/ATP-dependent DNA helicase PcrA
MAFPPTAQQQAFLVALTSTTGHLALVARAGCGKTSTILMGVDAVAAKQPRAEQLVCAFNKSIADEVGEKLKEAGHRDWRTVQSATLHSLGFGLLKYVFKPVIEEKKVRNIVAGLAANYETASNRDEAEVGETCATYGAQVEALVRYAKQAGVGFFNDLPIGDVGVWHQLADHFDVNGLDDTSEADAVVEAAQLVYRRSLQQTDVIDFDDMILFPLVKNLRVKFGKDYIFLDEAQDLSRARQALARKFLKPNTGRMIVVGDDRQAIYGFTGADADALPNLISQLGASMLPLTATWRCPTSVVALAQQYVPDIEAAASAPEGVVETVGDLPDDLAPGDAVLCRNTAPLITAAYRLIREGKACKVEGRSIGDGLIALANRWKVKNISTLLDRLAAYEEREVQKAMAKGNDSKVEEVQDKCETLRQICSAVSLRGGSTVADVGAFIVSLFADGADADKVIILATYHRSKGREWDRVFLWEHSTRCPSKAARQEWQLAQESNLAYVAITRAKRELYFVEATEEADTPE